MNYLFLVDSYYLEPSSNGVCSQAVITELQKIGHKVTVISMGNRNSVKILENGLKHYQVKYNFVRFGIVKKCAVEENPKSEIDRYQAA